MDNLSSAHVYLRLPEGGSITGIPEETLEDCAQLVKANSIQGELIWNDRDSGGFSRCAGRTPHCAQLLKAEFKQGVLVCKSHFFRMQCSGQGETTVAGNRLRAGCEWLSK